MTTVVVRSELAGQRSKLRFGFTPMRNGQDREAPGKNAGLPDHLKVEREA